VGAHVELQGLEGRIDGTGVVLGGVIEGGTDGRWDLHVRTKEALVLTPDLIAAIPHYLGEDTLPRRKRNLTKTTHAHVRPLGLHHKPYYTAD
jgi:hypothetical protein